MMSDAYNGVFPSNGIVLQRYIALSMMLLVASAEILPVIGNWTIGDSSSSNPGIPDFIQGSSQHNPYEFTTPAASIFCSTLYNQNISRPYHNGLGELRDCNDIHSFSTRFRLSNHDGSYRYLAPLPNKKMVVIYASPPKHGFFTSRYKGLALVY